MEFKVTKLLGQEEECSNANGTGGRMADRNDIVE